MSSGCRFPEHHQSGGGGGRVALVAVAVIVAAALAGPVVRAVTPALQVAGEAAEIIAVVVVCFVGLAVALTVTALTVRMVRWARRISRPRALPPHAPMRVVSVRRVGQVTGTGSRRALSAPRANVPTFPREHANARVVTRLVGRLHRAGRRS